MQLNRQWHPLEEVVGCGARPGCASGSKGGASTCDLDGCSAAGPARRVLIGQVLHQPARQRGEVHAAGHADRDQRRAPPDDGVRICGGGSRPRHRPGEEQRVFEKFYRARPEGATGRGRTRADDLPRHRGGARRSHLGGEPGRTAGRASASCCRSPSEPAGAAAGDADRAPRSMSEPRPVVVLIEDEPQIRRLLRTVLPEHGYRAVRGGNRQARAGRSGVRASPTWSILDLGLPDMRRRCSGRALREWSAGAGDRAVRSQRGSRQDRARSMPAPTTTSPSPSASASCSRACACALRRAARNEDGAARCSSAGPLKVDLAARGVSSLRVRRCI